MKIEIVRLYGKQPRNRRPLEEMSCEQLFKLHDYFIQTPPDMAVEGMDLDGYMIGPPITIESLKHLIPSRRLVENEMRNRDILIDG